MYGGERVDYGQRCQPDGLQFAGGTVPGGIIPYTYEHTNFNRIKPGTLVNLEFDIIGKYIARLMKNYLK